MKYLFLSSDKDSPVYMNYRGGFEASDSFDFNHTNYVDYDVILITGFQKDLDTIQNIRETNKNCLIGLVDPRGTYFEPYLDLIDFFIIDSLEMKDFFAGYNKPMHIYYEYPKISNQKKKHQDKSKIIIGYHGNKVHLQSLYPNINQALERLHEEFGIELWAMYNIEKLGKWTFGCPQIPIKHIQWSYANYTDMLARADIGIVPNSLPIKRLQKTKKRAAVCDKIFVDAPEDYLIRFKMLSNIGRIIIFSQLGIPVVSDMFPSALQVIQDEENGYLAYHAGGWYTALKKLIISSDKRQSTSDKLSESLEKKIDYNLQNEKLLSFCAHFNRDKTTHANIQDKEWSVIDQLQCNLGYVAHKINRAKTKLGRKI